MISIIRKNNLKLLLHAALFTLLANANFAAYGSSLPSIPELTIITGGSAAITYLAHTQSIAHSKQAAAETDREIANIREFDPFYLLKTSPNKEKRKKDLEWELLRSKNYSTITKSQYMFQTKLLNKFLDRIYPQLKEQVLFNDSNDKSSSKYDELLDQCSSSSIQFNQFINDCSDTSSSKYSELSNEWKIIQKQEIAKLEKTKTSRNLWDHVANIGKLATIIHVCALSYKGYKILNP